MKELPRKKYYLVRATAKNEDQTIDQNNGLEARISREENRTILSVGLAEIPPLFIKVFLQDQISHMGITIRTMEDHMINAQINHPRETIEMDLGMEFSTFRMETGEILETFLVIHQLKRETFHRIVQTASQEVISLKILLSADLTINLRLVLHPKNKNFNKTIFRRLLTRLAQPQLTIQLDIIRPLSVKLLRTPNSKTDKSRISRLSLNILYFATGDTQKHSGLEIEFMLDTGASCSIINYRIFWEKCQLQHPITIQKSTKVTKTYSGQTVPMIGYATITFSYDPDGQFIFLLTVWITEMRTQNLLGLDFY